MGSERLVVDDRIVVDLASGEAAAVQSRCAEDARIEVSPGGKQVLASCHGYLAWGESPAGPLHDLSIPGFISEETRHGQDVSSRTHMAAVWWTDTELLLVQANVNTGIGCGVYDTTRGTWAPWKTCPRSGVSVRMLVRGPDRALLAIGSAEGCVSAALGRVEGGGTWTFLEGRSGPFSSVTLGSDGPILSSRCDLSCHRCGSTECCTDGTLIHRWSDLSVIARDLPAGAAASADGKRVAWSSGGQVCVAPLTDTASARCLPLPD